MTNVPYTDPPHVFQELSPSAKYVYFALVKNGEMTNKEISEATWLPDRTVRWALDKLEEIDGVRSRPSPTDARQNYHRPVAFHTMEEPDD